MELIQSYIKISGHRRWYIIVNQAIGLQFSPFLILHSLVCEGVGRVLCISFQRLNLCDYNHNLDRKPLHHHRRTL